MIFFSFFLILCGIAIYGEFNIYISMCAVFCAVFFFLKAYKKNKISFFLLIQFFIGALWCVASLYYIELGNYISEQKRYGENIGALVRYTVYTSLFLFFAYITLNIVVKHKLSSSFSMIRHERFFDIATKSFFVFIVGMSLLIMSIYGVPLLKGMARFQFYKMIEPFDKIIFLMPICAFFLGIKKALDSANFSICALFILVAILVLFSDKFSGIFSVMVYYIIGFYVTKNILVRNISLGFNKKILLIYFPISFCFLLSTVIFGFLFLQGADASDIIDRVLSRALGLQAHVWYGIDEQLSRGYLSPNAEIFFLQNKEPEQPAGLIYLMYQVADYDFVRSFREAGIRFTNGYPAIVLISFGYTFSFFILAFLGVLLGYILYYLFLKVYYLQPIRLLVSLILYNNIIVNIFIMGEVYYIYKPLLFLCLFFILFDIFILKHKNILLRPRLKENLC